MLFSLPLSLILATCAVARTTPRRCQICHQDGNLSTHSRNCTVELQSGLEKRDTYDLCAEGTLGRSGAPGDTGLL